jgi:hypothetical protein
MPSDKIAQQMADSTVMVTALTTDTEIIAQLQPLGIDAARRNGGTLLLRAAVAAVQKADELQAAQLRATKAFNDGLKVRKEQHADLAKICRAVFVKEASTLAQLGLDQKTPLATAEFIRAAEKLYTVAITSPEPIGATLGTYGYPPDRLTEERDQIVGLRAEKAAQETAKSKAQEATAVQTKALAALADYIVQIRKIARVALKKRPQLLERLGIITA